MSRAGLISGCRLRRFVNRIGRINALGNLGLAYAALGDARQAIEFYEQCLALHRELGDRRGEGNDLANLGMAYKNLREKEKARALWGQALEIYRAIESPHAQTVESWLAGSPSTNSDHEFSNELPSRQTLFSL